MKGRWLFSGLAAALLTPALFGAEVNRSWETLVATLKPGRKVTVVQHSRKQAEGKLLNLTGESITVQAGAQPLTIQRDDVFRVRVAVDPHETLPNRVRYWGRCRRGFRS